MNNRKEEIIESAMKLFASDGYHTTSMQKLADRCGIAKSSLYNYFTSKEEIMLTIFKHYYQYFFEKIEGVKENDRFTPREALIEHISIQLEQFLQHKDFIRMQMREQIVQGNDEIHQFVFNMRAQMLNYNAMRLREAYGSQVEPYILDCVTMLTGIIKEYMFYLIFDQIDIDIKKMGAFIVNRLDAIVNSFVDQEQPLLTKPLMKNFIHAEENMKNNAKRQIQKSIKRLSMLVSNLSFDDKKLEKLESTLDALNEECMSEEPKLVIFESLLLFLENQNIPEFEIELKELNHYVFAYSQ